MRGSVDRSSAPLDPSSRCGCRGKSTRNRVNWFWSGARDRKLNQNDISWLFLQISSDIFVRVTNLCARSRRFEVNFQLSYISIFRIDHFGAANTRRQYERSISKTINIKMVLRETRVRQIYMLEEEAKRWTSVLFLKRVLSVHMFDVIFTGTRWKISLKIFEIRNLICKVNGIAKRKNECFLEASSLSLEAFQVI